MSRWGKPKKNKRFIDPRYYLEEKNEELLEEGFGRWLQDNVMAPVFLGDEELERYQEAGTTERASDIAHQQRHRGVTDEDLALAQSQGPYDLGQAYEDTAEDLWGPSGYLTQQAKPWLDDALEAGSRAIARGTQHWAPALSDLTRFLGPALEAPLFYYGATNPDDPTLSPWQNLDPRLRSFADPTSEEGARQWGSQFGAAIGSLLGGRYGGPKGAAAGGMAGDFVGHWTGDLGRQLGQSLSDYWNRRPELIGGMTDEQLQDAYWDQYQAETGTGAYRTQRAPAHIARETGQVLQDPNLGHAWYLDPVLAPSEYLRNPVLATYRSLDLPGLDPVPPPPGTPAGAIREHFAPEEVRPAHLREGKRNNMKPLLTESEIKRFKTLSNLKEKKPVLTESLTAALGLLSLLVVPASMAASYAVSKAQQRGRMRDSPMLQPSPYVQKSAERIRQRAKEQDPLMLSFVKQLTQNKRFFGPMKTKLMALSQEFGDDPNVADIVETLSYSSNADELYAALEELQNYLESKSSEQNGEQI